MVSLKGPLIIVLAGVVMVMAFFFADLQKARTLIYESYSVFCMFIGVVDSSAQWYNWCARCNVYMDACPFDFMSAEERYAIALSHCASGGDVDDLHDMKFNVTQMLEEKIKAPLRS